MQHRFWMLSRPLRRWLALAAVLGPGACSLNPQPDLPGDRGFEHSPGSPDLGGDTGGTKSAGMGDNSGGLVVGPGSPSGGTFSGGGTFNTAGSFSQGGILNGAGENAGGEAPTAPVGGESSGGAPEQAGGAGG